MDKRKQAPEQIEFVDISSIDCTELAILIQLAINVKRCPTEDDLTKVRLSSSDQINKCLYRYNEIERPTPIENCWADCLEYALLINTVSAEMAEYHCPKHTWLQTPQHNAS